LTSDFKREYIDGQAYAVPGAGYSHNCIAGNVFRKFGNHLEGKPCTPFTADMKVRLGKGYVYPDVVDCGKMSGSDMFSENPALIVEVLSKSTRKTDMAVKLLRYINLPSLQGYVLIEPDFVSVQMLRRNRHWLPEYYLLSRSNRSG
jgi:Uma2 family endonuclease